MALLSAKQAQIVDEGLAFVAIFEQAPPTGDLDEQPWFDVCRSEADEFESYEGIDWTAWRQFAVFAIHRLTDAYARDENRLLIFLATRGDYRLSRGQWEALRRLFGKASRTNAPPARPKPVRRNKVARARTTDREAFEA